jgi:hypothetical protein
MNQEQKTISDMPVDELWEGQKLVSTDKVRDVGSSDIVDLLRSGLVRFVVADIGKPFDWIPTNKSFDFWKAEIKTHLAEPESKAFLEDFPNEYCYFASEWKSSNDERIILLSKMH